MRPVLPTLNVGLPLLLLAAAELLWDVLPVVVVIDSLGSDDMAGVVSFVSELNDSVVVFIDRCVSVFETGDEASPAVVTLLMLVFFVQLPFSSAAVVSVPPGAVAVASALLEVVVLAGVVATLFVSASPGTISAGVPSLLFEAAAGEIGALVASILAGDLVPVAISFSVGFFSVWVLAVFSLRRSIEPQIFFTRPVDDGAASGTVVFEIVSPSARTGPVAALAKLNASDKDNAFTANFETDFFIMAPSGRRRILIVSLQILHNMSVSSSRARKALRCS